MKKRHETKQYSRMMPQHATNRGWLVPFAMLMTSTLLAACASYIEPGEPLLAADEIKAGPGVFSGESGAFSLLGGDKKKPKSVPSPTLSAKSTPNQDLKETSSLLKQKIDMLEQQQKQQQKELEMLKRQVDQK